MSTAEESWGFDSRDIQPQYLIGARIANRAGTTYEVRMVRGDGMFIVKREVDGRYLAVSQEHIEKEMRIVGESGRIRVGNT